MSEGYDGLPSYYSQSSDPLTPNFGLSLKGMDPILAENMVIIDENLGGGGTSVLVNNVSISNPNFNDTTPAPPGNATNVSWQVSGSDVSGYIDCVTSFFGNDGNITALNDGTKIQDAAAESITFSASLGLVLKSSNSTQIEIGGSANPGVLSIVGVTASIANTVGDGFNITTGSGITATDSVGTVWGSATGGAKGSGTINATGLFINGAAAVTATTAPVRSVFGRTGAVVAGANDYTGITNLVFSDSSSLPQSSITFQTASQSIAIQVKNQFSVTTNAFASFKVGDTSGNGDFSLQGGGVALISTDTAGNAITLTSSSPFAVQGAQSSNTFGMTVTNTTAATSGQAQAAQLVLGGKYWTGTVSAADTWTISDTIANGTNGISTLTFSHSGSGGIPKALFSGLASGSTLTFGNAVIGSGAWVSIANSAHAGMSNGANPLDFVGSPVNFSFNSGAQSQAIFQTTDYSFINVTAATVSVSQSSPTITLNGKYWNGASATDTWTFQNVLANGLNGASTLTIAHSGTSGTAAIQAPATVGVYGWTGGTGGVGPGGGGNTNQVGIVTGGSENWRFTGTSFTSAANISLDVGGGLNGTGKFSVAGSTGIVARFNNEVTAGIGNAYIRGVTSQKSETGADVALLSVTPAASVGVYRISVVLSVSAATAATLGWTATWTDSNGNAQAPTNLSLSTSGSSTLALTVSAAANATYYGEWYVDVNSAGTAIVVKTTFSGTSIAYKASAIVERVA